MGRSQTTPAPFSGDRRLLPYPVADVAEASLGSAETMVIDTVLEVPGRRSPVLSRVHEGVVDEDPDLPGVRVVRHLEVPPPLVDAGRDDTAPVGLDGAAGLVVDVHHDVGGVRS